jgi:hypothetical protein
MQSLTVVVNSFMIIIFKLLSGNATASVYLPPLYLRSRCRYSTLVFDAFYSESE